jgi:hypothetical protein
MTIDKTSMTYLDGVVEAVNDHGLRLGDRWHRFSRYATALASVTPGQYVRLGLYGQGFIREILVAAQPDSSSTPAVVCPDPSISRLAVVKSASVLAASRGEEVRSSNLLKIADGWLQWIQSDRNGDGARA